MLFKRIEMFNFGRYEGKHSINTAVTQDRNVILVRAHNDRGKTTLFKAIRYALYGEQGIQASSWINLHAASKGGDKMYVEIKFEHDGKEYRLKRSVEFLQTKKGMDISTRGHPRVELFDENGTVETGDVKDVYKDWIDGILPMDASRFFFFDGEEIQKYIDVQSAHVEDAMKKILGIKELFNAAEDMKEIKSEMGAKYSQIARKQSKNEKEKYKLDQLGRDLDSVRKDLEGQETVVKGAKRRREELKNMLMEYKSIEGIVGERDRAEREIGKIKAEMAEVDKMLDKQRGNLGIGMLAGLLYEIDRSNGLEQAVDDCEKITIHSILGQAERICICGRPVDVAAYKTLKLKASDGEPPVAQQLRRFVQRLLIDLQPAKRATELGQSVERRSKLVQGMDTQRTVVKRCTEKINASAPLEAMRSLERQYEEVGMDIGRCESEIRVLRAEQHKKENEKKKVELKIESGVDDEQLRNARRRKDVCDVVIDGICEAVERYYKRRKPELENLISRIFCQLTNNPEMYRGIEIDRQFNLQVVHHDGTKLPTNKYSPSQGASQIVATAMIGGLNRFATKDAPIVIDTPLGRLDPTHRSNVMRYYSHMGKQIIILYQPSEIEKDDLESIRDNLASEWVIESVPDKPDMSHIVQGVSYL